MGFGSGEEVVGAATALDLRLDPNPRPFSREFRELIRRDGAARDGGSTTTATTTAAQRRSGRGILLYYVWIEMGWVEGGNGGRIWALVSIRRALTRPEPTPWEARLASTGTGGRLGTTRSREGLAALLFVVYLCLASCVHTSGGAGVVSQIREDGRSRPGSRVCRVWNKEGGRGREGRGSGKGEEPAWWWFVPRVAIARQNPGGPFGYVMYQPNSNPARKWGT